MSVIVHRLGALFAARAGRSALLAILLVAPLGCGSEDLSVTISSPDTEKAHVRAALAVQVFVEGDPDDVDLRMDGQPLVRLPAPYQYVWDVTGLPEGEYTLSARATRGGTTVESKPLQVVVDRTAPILVSRTPAPDSRGEWTGAIAFTASEPLQPGSVTDTTVLLRTPEGQPLRKQLVLSGDGGTVELRVDPPLSLPSRLEAAITPGVTDLAGNPLVLSTEAWSWDVPAARLLGDTPLQPDHRVYGSLQPALLVSEQGHPIIAYMTMGAPERIAYRSEVARWNGGAWEYFPHPEMEGQPRLALDASGSLVAASASFGRLVLKRLEGTQWRLMTRSYSAEDGMSHEDIRMQLALRRDGMPLVAWNRPSGPNGASSIARVLSPNATGWEELAAFPDGRIHGLVVDATGNTWLAWSALTGTRGLRVGRLEGNTFVQVGGLLEAEAGTASRADVADLKVDASGRPLIAWRDGEHLYVHTWDGTRWSQVGERHPAGGNPEGAANSLSLALAPGGRPVVAWVVRPGPETTAELRVEAWTGTGWVPHLPPQPAGYFHGVALALDKDGRPVVAWYEAEVVRTTPVYETRPRLRVRAGR
jgi:hypothetical protein